MTIVTKNGFCINCLRTKILMKSYNINFHVSDGEVIPEQLKNAGFTSYPVVEPNDRLYDKANWDGFNANKIKQYSKKS